MVDDIEMETGTADETSDGNAGVSDRSEREIETGAEGAEQRAAEGDDGKDADEALDALAEADPKRAVVGLRKRLAKLTAQRNAARSEAGERKALEARLAAYEKRERDDVDARKAAERATPAGQKAEERRQAVRATLDEAFYPGYSEQQEAAAKRQSDIEAQAVEQHTLRALEYLTNDLLAHNVKVKDKDLIHWERAVASEIAEDPELKAAYQRPASQRQAVEVALDRFRDGIANKILEERGGKPLERIQRNREAVLGGGQNRGTVAQVDEPTFDLTPPKGLHGRALTEWWDNARDSYRDKLLAASD